MVHDEITHISLEGHVGERPGEIVVKTPVRLSANAAKQKIFPTELMSSSMMTEGPWLNGPAWIDGSEMSSIQLSSSTIGAACTFGPCRPDGGGCGCCAIVLRIP